MALKVTVFGAGHLGLVSTVCMANFGINVICVDTDENKIERLKRGKLPIYEPGLDSLLERNLKIERIKFTINAKKAIEESDIIFIDVGTPSAEDGQAEMKYVYKVAETIGEYINSYKVIVCKSTVPVGTGKRIKSIISQGIKERDVKFGFDIVSNPKFLRTGKAIQDFIHPDRIIIGVENKKAEEVMKRVYTRLFTNNIPFVVTDIETAEMAKYASNAFLSTKITLINEIANLCEKVGANVKEVASAMGLDPRIGPEFLEAGPGYGGSCFSKDTKALVAMADKHGTKMDLVKAVISTNEEQKKLSVKKLETELNGLEGKNIGILGISFKPETDDLRESPSLTIIKGLVEKGASIRVYDPQSMKEAKAIFTEIEDRILFCKHAYDTAEGVDALMIITEWHEFKNMDLVLLKKIMNNHVFYDARNIYTRTEVEGMGFKYIGTGV